MKKIMMLLLIVTGALQAHADSDCLAAIRDAFKLQASENMTEIQGEGCGLKVRYNQTVSGLTNQSYRLVDMSIDQEGKIGTLIRFEDNTAGLNTYTIKKCDISAAGIDLVYSQHENYGWHRTTDYKITLWTQNNRVIGMTASEDREEYSCRFK